MKFDHVILEDLDLTTCSSLNIVNVGIEECLSCRSCQVGTDHSSLNGIDCAIWVGAHSLSLDRLVLTVDQHSLKRSDWEQVAVVSSMDK